jgi:DNA-binding response OmpR family regulator
MPKRILVVEDEHNVLAVIRRRLQAAGYEVIDARDGVEALDVARKQKLDLIVLDLMLPRLDGNAVCRELRHDPARAQVPIIMLTARTQKKEVLQGMVDGANIYMTKPFKNTQLLANIRDLLTAVDRDAAIQAELQPRT